MGYLTLIPGTASQRNPQDPKPRSWYSPLRRRTGLAAHDAPSAAAEPAARGPDGWACGQVRADFDALLYVVSNAGRIRPLTEVVRPGGSVASTVSAADVEALAHD
jgi:hypothetical protein